MRSLDLEALRTALRSSIDARTELESHPAPKAAVAALVRENGGTTEVLLIRRAEREGDPWSGHMGFPGGRHDPVDSDPIATALRETREELGVDLGQHGSLIGKLPPLPAIGRTRSLGLVVFPYVYEITAPIELLPNEEVAETFWTPLVPLFHGQRNATLPYVWQGAQLQMPGYQVGDHIVWGMTYRMLQSLFEVLRGGR